MTAWPTTPLGTVCDVVGGGTPSRDTPEFFGGDIPWITPTDVTRSRGRYLSQGAETITEIGLQRSSAKLLPARSVLLTSRATIGFTAINTVPVTTNQGFASFVCGPDIYPEFLAYWLEWSRDRLIELASGATFKEINKSTLKRLPIPLPPLGEQRRIVGLLDRAAEIRRRADAARAKARAIIPALFLDTFGDPATNPKGWPVMTLGDTIISGPQNGLYKPATDYGSGVRILRIDSFDDGTIANQGALKRLRLDQETTDKFELSEGDIVVNRVNSPPQLGKSVLIPRLEEPVVFESNMMRMRVNSDLLLPPVLGVMLQLNSVRQALIKNAKHAINQSSINQGDVTGITVVAPPIQLQSVFAEHIQRIDAVARHLDAAAAKAEAMAAGLSAEVFGQSPSKGNGHG